MASLDTLPGDQRAVLQLVLGRGRSYDEIARLLRINPESVRARALAALDALGPQTRVSDEDRTRICDYLLGQLPDSDLPAVRDLLAHSAGERAWARVLSSELAPVAAGPLPEIPLDTGSAPPPPPAAPAATPPVAPAPAGNGPAPAMPAPAMPALEVPAPDGAATPRRRGLRRAAKPPGSRKPPAPSRGSAAGDPGSGDGPRSSRRGGIVVIGIGVIVLILVLVLVFKNGSSNKSPSPSAAAATTSSNPAVSSTTTTTTGANGSTTTSATTTSGSAAASAYPNAKVLAQINLTPATAGSKAVGIAAVLQEGTTKELAIDGQHVPANTSAPRTAYEVWLYNSPSDAVSLGFVNPGVTSNGRLSAAGPLPANASRYKELIVTTETTAQPKAPGPILLQGPVTGLS